MAGNEDLGNQLSQLQEMKKILADLPAMFDKLGSSAGNQTDPIRQLVGSLEEASGKSDGFKDMDGALNELAGATDKGAAGMSKMNIAAGVALAGVAGLKAGMDTFSNILGSTFNAVSGRG